VCSFFFFERVRKGQIDPQEREKWIEIGENGQRVLFLSIRVL